MQSMPAGFELRQKATLKHEDIGGGKVRRRFRMGEKMMEQGQLMTREEIMSIPYGNRVALIDRFIEVWPSEAPLPGPPVLDGEIEAFIIHCGAGKYNVIEGVRRNDEPLQKHEADDLVARLKKRNGS